jgi:hypothetical protein
MRSRARGFGAAERCQRSLTWRREHCGNIFMLPQRRWKSIDLDLDLDADVKIKRIVSFDDGDIQMIKKFHRNLSEIDKDQVSVEHLKVGDVLFVKGSNAVFLSQKLARFIAMDKSKYGDAETVHCLIVTQANEIHVRVSHVNRRGGLHSFLEDPINVDEFKKAGLEYSEEAHTIHAVVYRLKYQDIGEKAAGVAAGLVDRSMVQFSVQRGIKSIFRNPKIGTYLSENQKHIFNPKKKYSVFATIKRFFKRYVSSPERISAVETKKIPEAKEDEQQEAQYFDTFCSEFVIKCFQEALAHIEDRNLSPEELSSIDLKGNASSPMLFEGYVAKNTQSWTRIGKLTAEFM